MHLKERVGRLEEAIRCLRNTGIAAALEHLSSEEKAALLTFGQVVHEIMAGKTREEQAALGRQIVKMVRAPLPAWLSDAVLRAEYEEDLLTR